MPIATPPMEAVEGVVPGPVTSGGLLDELTEDFKRLQEQKARASGGVEGWTLVNIAFSEGEHFIDYRHRKLFAETRDDNKLYLNFNLTGRRVGKLLGRLSALDPPYKAVPDKRDSVSTNDAKVVDKLIDGLDHILDQPSRTWEILYWLLHGGTAFEYIPWVPNAHLELKPQFDPESGELLYRNFADNSILPESQKDNLVMTGAAPEQFEVYEDVEMDGEVGSEVVGPLNVFLDQGVRSVADLAPDQWVHIARIRTVGWVRDNFDVEVEPDTNLSIVTTQLMTNTESSAGHFLQDLIPLVQGSRGKNDPGVCVVVESYLPASKLNPNGRYTCWVPNKQILHDAENPYKEIPLVDFHWKPVTINFWTSPYVSDLIAPQRFLNKRISQLGEQSNASLYSLLLLGGSLKAKDIPADRPGVVEGALGESGAPLVQRLPPPEIPAWFMSSMDMTVKLFNDIAGGMDLMDDTKFPGQMRGPLAVPMLQEILDTEWGPFYRHMAERMGRVKQMRLNRVKQFYPPIRTLHFVSKDQKDEVLEFHKEAILDKGINYNITLQPGPLLPELRALREQRVANRLAGPLQVLYLDDRTGKIDRTKVAQDLDEGDAGRASREEQYRKLAKELIALLWRNLPVPPPLPFYDHRVMMDELEAAMATTEYLQASPQVQMAFGQRWEAHRGFLAMEAQAQQAAMQAGAVHQAVAQATQQAAAQAAAETVHATMQQVGAQQQLQAGGQTHAFVQSAIDQNGGNRGNPRR